jgi:predicted exporter
LACCWWSRSVNYALFFDRQTASAQDRERTIVSLVFANATTVIGFGLLAFSKVPVLNAIGSTVGIGAILSLVFSAILITRTRYSGQLLLKP